MPLTNAERAKRYRERKKHRDPSFIEKERKRQNRVRVPRREMAPHRLLLARHKCAGYKKAARERTKRATNSEATSCDTATRDQVLIQFHLCIHIISFALEMANNCCSVLN